MDDTMAALRELAEAKLTLDELTSIIAEVLENKELPDGLSADDAERLVETYRTFLTLREL